MFPAGRMGRRDGVCLAGFFVEYFKCVHDVYLLLWKKKPPDNLKTLWKRNDNFFYGPVRVTRTINDGTSNNVRADETKSRNNFPNKLRLVRSLGTLDSRRVIFRRHRYNIYVILSFSFSARRRFHVLAPTRHAQVRTIVAKKQFFYIGTRTIMK